MVRQVFATFSQGMKVGGGNALRKAVISILLLGVGVAAGDINLDYGMVHLNTNVLAGTGNTINITSAVGINTQKLEILLLLLELLL